MKLMPREIVKISNVGIFFTTAANTGEMLQQTRPRYPIKVCLLIISLSFNITHILTSLFSENYILNNNYSQIMLAALI